MLFARPLAELIAALEKLPGIGPKSAQRLAYHLLRQPEHEVLNLARAIENAKAKLGFCAQCQNIAAEETCEICQNPRRDRTVICVVAEPRDIAAVERANEYKGMYHVLHGLLDPVDRIGPESLRIRELLARLTGDEVQEVILATNNTIEGDTTALYLVKLIKPAGIRVTRLAHGLPSGAEIDYADTATLMSAIEYRREM